MAKKASIRFDMEDTEDISNQLIEVQNDYYIKPTSYKQGSLRFPIPKPIAIDLQLKTGDTCFFCQYSEGFYISFKHKPIAATKQQIRARNISTAGRNTLYVNIPPMIKKLYQKTITNVKLIHTKGFQPYEWQLQFLFTECI